jgi:nickel/cobalt exporter
MGARRASEGENVVGQNRVALASASGSPVVLLGLIAFLSLAANIHAHPVPKSNHDRTVRISLVPGAKPGDLTVRVAYRLEVDETTVVLDDMKPFQDQIDPAAFKGRALGYYAEYMRIYAPILARHLSAAIDGRDLEFKSVGGVPALKDEDGKDLGHLRCDFVFEATASHPLKGPFPFAFREGSFLLQEGDIRLSLDPSGPWFIDVKAAPDEELWKRPATEARPGDDDRLRELKALVHYFPNRNAPEPAPPSAPVSPLPESPAPATAPEADDDHSLLRLVQSDHTFWLMLLLTAAFGAAHALTPGHGKTLVAAYLVGQRGTVVHAVALGIISTLTHTWSVLALAGVVHWFGLSPSARAWIQSSLPLILGLMIVCFGFLLLLQRLAGRADHIHIGGGHHHHEHGHHHEHDAKTEVTWGGLLLLGITGSIIPCWDAIAMLIWSIGADRLSWAVPLLLAFSAGLAAVLVTIGILVVKARGFADSHFGASRWVRALPIASALAIIVLGFWLCRQAVTASP